MGEVISGLVRWSFAFSPIFSFAPQLHKQIKTGVDGYSRGTAFLLISAHVLRLFWWLVQPFDLSLLAQSLCTITMQLLLLNSSLMLLRASDEKKSPRSSTQQENLKTAALEAGADMSHKAGGEWEELEPYFILILGTSLFLGFTLIYFNQATVLVRSLATVSAGLEGVLAWPQIYTNFRSKDTSSLSVVMVSGWLVGDIIKTVAFMFNPAAPRVLVTSAIGQCVADVIVLFQQVILYPSCEVVRLMRTGSKFSNVLRTRGFKSKKLNGHSLPGVVSHVVDP